MVTSAPAEVECHFDSAMLRQKWVGGLKEEETVWQITLCTVKTDLSSVEFVTLFNMTPFFFIDVIQISVGI